MSCDARECVSKMTIGRSVYGTILHRFVSFLVPHKIRVAELMGMNTFDDGLCILMEFTYECSLVYRNHTLHQSKTTRFIRVNHISHDDGAFSHIRYVTMLFDLSIRGGKKQNIPK